MIELDETPVEFAGLVLEDQLLDHLGTPEGCIAVWKARLNPEVIPETLEDYQLYRDALNVVMTFMDEHREPPDISVLAEEIGNEDFNVPIAPIGYVIERLQEKYKRRALKTILGAEAQALARADEDPGTIIADALENLAKLKLETATKRGIITSDDLGQSVMRYRQRQEQGERGVSFGFEKIDDHMGGLNLGELTILLARPKRYKSWLMLNSAGVAVEDCNVAFATLELDEEEMSDRYLCLMADVSWQKFKQGTLREEELLRLETTGHNLMEHPFKAHFFRPQAGERSVAEIVAYAREIGAGVLYIDQLSWLDGARDERYARHRIGEAMEQLKDAAEEFPILMAAQLNRAAMAEDGLADISKIAEADFVGQTADNLLAIHASTDMMRSTPRIIHLGLQESRSYEPKAWEIKVELSSTVDFKCLDELDTH